MRIDIATLFPEMCETVLSESIIGRARRKGILQFFCHNIRDYTLDKHRRVDDAPYGGGMGMVMQADPIYRCFEDVREKLGKRPHVIYLSPQGKSLTQAKAVELSKMDGLMLICGHYEGVDERVIEEIVDEEISIGDYVLTGGELPALVLADTVCRLIPECFPMRRVLRRKVTMQDCWNTLSIPALLSGMTGKFLPSFLPDTMQILENGAASSRLSARCTNARICSRTPRLTKRIGNSSVCCNRKKSNGGLFIGMGYGKCSFFLEVS